MKLFTISPDEVLKDIELDLRFNLSPEATKIAAISEHLRAIVALDSVGDANGGRYPVHTIRLTQPVLSRLIPLWPNSNSESVSYELDRLEELGDLVCSNGKWYIGPTRLIKIDNTSCLVIGGGALQTFPFLLRAEIQIVGRARILKITQKNQNIISNLPFQKLEDWLGVPNDDVEDWAKAYLKTKIKEAKSVDQIEDATVYSLHRWVPIEQYRGDNSIILYRRPVLNYGVKTFAYGLAKIIPSTSTLPQILAVVDIARDDARRLQGAMHNKDNPPYIQYWSQGPRIILRLPHPLPSPENRFLSLGWPVVEGEAQKQWPKEFYFSERLLPLITGVLDILGYKLKEK